LADGTITTCSLDNDPDLFKAALVSLGSLGIIIRLKMKASPEYRLKYTLETIPLSRFLAEYDAIWSSATYVRVWWGPYNRKVVVWRANRTQAALSPPPPDPRNPLSRIAARYKLGRKLYELLLYCGKYKPSLLPRLEKIFFKYSESPADENVVSESTVGNTHQSLQIDCYFSQYVDDWAVPLSKGVEAISRLDRWINVRDFSAETGIPVPTTRRLYVHAPIEIRVSSGKDDHAFLSPAREGTAVIWIGVLMYRPYYSPTEYRRYFSAYEYLMRSLGGKPHWAKQNSVAAKESRQIFGDGMEKWLAVRERVDPRGVFVNGFVRRHLLGSGTSESAREAIGVGIMDGESGRLYKRFRAVL
jgi:D-arabinono-1,4-lactone oxidase